MRIFKCRYSLHGTILCPSKFIIHKEMNIEIQMIGNSCLINNYSRKMFQKYNKSEGKLITVRQILS